MRRHGTTTALLLGMVLLTGQLDAGQGNRQRGEQPRAERVEQQERRAKNKSARAERAQHRAERAQRTREVVAAQQQRVSRAQERRDAVQQHRENRQRQVERGRQSVRQRIADLPQRLWRGERPRRLDPRERVLVPIQRRAVAPLRDPGRGRFAGLDRDGDGRIARHEWRGNDVSFRNQDWNRDGILAGVEVRPGGRRAVAWRAPVASATRVDRALQRERERFARVAMTRDERRFLVRNTIPRLEGPAIEQRRRVVARAEARRWQAPLRWVGWPDRWRRSAPRTVLAPPQLVALPPLPGAVWMSLDEGRLERTVQRLDFGPVDLVVQRFDTRPVDRVLLVDRFLLLDRDHDRVVTWREWPGERDLFRRLDSDRDRRLVMDDLLVHQDRLEEVLMVDRERYVAFHLLDLDDDGVVAPWEWSGDLDVFFLLDVDNDGIVAQSEYLGLARTRPVPMTLVVQRDLDLDGDGDIERVEWIGDPYRFARLDLDDDGAIEPFEALAGWALRA